MSKYLIKLSSIGDDRGQLVALEAMKNVPFAIKRVYYLYDLKRDVPRGFHAHKNLKQIVVCTSGSCEFILDDGKKRETVKLQRPDEALLVENFIWREMHNFSPDCVVMVLASELYDEDDYIRNYDDFLSTVRA